MRPFARTAATLAALVLAAGCGSDATSPQDQFPGTYSLRTFNGQSLPAVFPTDDTTGIYAIVSDVYTFKSDGTLSETAQVRYTPTGGGTAVTDNESYTGTWNLSGTAVTLHLSDNTTFTGTFSGGNTITSTNGSFTLVYQK